jgi:hypothetical protein
MYYFHFTLKYEKIPLVRPSKTHSPNLTPEMPRRGKIGGRSMKKVIFWGFFFKMGW